MELKEGYKQTEVGVIPEDWELETLLNVSDQIMDYRGRTPKKLGFEWGGGEIPALSAGNVKAGYIDFDAECYYGSDELYRRWMTRGDIKKGDILFTTEAPLGNVALVPDDRRYILSQRTVLLQVNSEIASSRYLFQSMLSDAFQRVLADYSSGSTAKGIQRKKFEQLYVALPPTKAEQEAIAEALSDADALIESLEQLIAKKRQIKQGAMQELLTGKKRLPGFSGEWLVKLLPEVSRFRGGKAHEQHIAEHGRFVCVNSKFISSDGKVRKYSTANFCCAKKDDVLMVMSDLPNGKALAKTFLADCDDLYAVNQRVCALTALDNYCGKFLSYILNRNPYFLKFDDGVSQTHLLNRVFEKCPLFVPPTKDEQTAIATILSDMDAEIAALETKLAKARQVKQGMMQELLTGNIRLI